MDIQDRIVVVTGAGSGIGEALAKAFASSGARHVVATDRNTGEAERVASEIKDEGGSASSSHLDVADEAALRALVETVEPCRLLRHFSSILLNFVNISNISPISFESTTTSQTHCAEISIHFFHR